MPVQMRAHGPVTCEGGVGGFSPVCGRHLALLELAFPQVHHGPYAVIETEIAWKAK